MGTGTMEPVGAAQVLRGEPAKLASLYGSGDGYGSGGRPS